MREDALVLATAPTEVLLVVAGNSSSITVPNTKAGRKAHYCFCSAYAAGVAVAFRIRGHVATVDGTTEVTVPFIPPQGVVLNTGGFDTLLAFSPTGGAANVVVSVAALEWD